MAALKYSRQRESIKHYLMTTKEHPTADTVYMHVKKEFPNISLGTVYRNIARFKEDGLIISVGVVEGQERLDGTTAPHAHFICSKCGCVLDVEDVEQDAQLDFDVSKRIRCQIDSHDLVFHGICEECLNAQKNAG